MSAIFKSNRFAGHRTSVAGGNDVGERFVIMNMKKSAYTSWRPIDAFQQQPERIFTHLTTNILWKILGCCASMVWLNYSVMQKVLLRRLLFLYVLYSMGKAVGVSVINRQPVGLSGALACDTHVNAIIVLTPLNFVGYSGVVVMVAGTMYSSFGHLWWPGLKRRAPATVIKPTDK